MIENIKLVTTLLILFGCSWGANSIFGILLNVNIIGYDFDIKKMLNSLAKAIMLCCGLLLMTSVISYLPTLLKNQNVVMVDNDFSKWASMIGILTIFINGIYKYLGQAVGKIKLILGLTEDDIIELKYEHLSNDNKELEELHDNFPQ
jgi:cytochrome bd-type quinol oxidase subunit 2